MPAISPAHAVLALASTMCFNTPIVTDKGQTFGKVGGGGGIGLQVDMFITLLCVHDRSVGSGLQVGMFIIVCS